MRFSVSIFAGAIVVMRRVAGSTARTTAWGAYWVVVASGTNTTRPSRDALDGCAAALAATMTNRSGTSPSTFTIRTVARKCQVKVEKGRRAEWAGHLLHGRRTTTPGTHPLGHRLGLPALPAGRGLPARPPRAELHRPMTARALFRLERVGCLLVAHSAPLNLPPATPAAVVASRAGAPQVGR